jgi:flagellar basal-body rod protein FlgB
LLNSLSATGGKPDMTDSVLFDKTLDVAAKALDLRSQRHALIVSNLANADTPGYKAFDLLVEESIQKQNQVQPHVQMTRTQPGHFSAPGDTGFGNAAEIIRTPAPNDLRGDGNTVDMDREMSNLAANQLLYRASAQVVAKKFQWLKSVITGGK